MPMLHIPSLLTDSADGLRGRLPLRIFRGTSLLEVVLAATITTSLVGIIASSLEVSRRLWQTQEANSAVDLSQSATQWLVDQIHQANGVRILNSSSLELTFQQGSATLTKTITRQGNSLVAINQSNQSQSQSRSSQTQTLAFPLPSGGTFTMQVPTRSSTAPTSSSNRWTETIAEPVRDLHFSDPNGRGHSVRVQLTAQGSSPRQPTVRQDRIVAIDWLKS